MATRRFVGWPDPRAVGWALGLWLALPGAAQGAPTLSLREALDQALRSSPVLLASDARGDQASATHDEAQAGLWPSLQGLATFTQLDSDRVVGGHVITYATTGSAALVGSMPLVDPRRWVGISTTRRQEELAEAETKDARRRVLADVASAYLAVNTSKREVEAAQVALDYALQHLDIARSRRVAGAGSSVDEVRAQQEVDRLRVDLASAGRAVDERQEALGLLVGTNGPIDASEQPTFASIGPVQPAQFEARADLEVARTRVAVANYVRRTSWTEWSPALTVLASAFVDSPATGLAPADGWSVQLALAGRLFDGGETSARTRRRAAAEREAQTAYDAQRRLATAELRRSQTAIRFNTEALGSAQSSAVSSRQVLDLVSAAYREGAQTNIEVIDAERRFHDATLEVARAQQALEQSRLDLLFAEGQLP